jgi:DUF917 family protein/N-methylhydantoinase A/oxoprolinase/acetone carboxylase beta subunit
MKNQNDYLYSKEKLFLDWTDDRKTPLTKKLFLTKLEELFVKLWFIENKFDPEQQEQQIKNFNKYDLNKDELLEKEEFNLYYDEVLSDLLKIHYVVGIDVGGTNTDAVILEMPEIKIISWTKVPTTSDIRTGVFNALVSVFEKQSLISKDDIKAVFIGTTAFVNAVIQRSDYLSKVSVFRLCGKSSTALYPFINFPKDLRNKVEQKSYLLSGGLHYSGGAGLTDVSLQEVREKGEELVKYLKENNLNEVHVAIVGLFSPVNNCQEKLVSEELERVFKEQGLYYTITLSSDVGELGLLERENATILNASLKSYVRKTVNSFRSSLFEFGFKNNFYFTQNDGTVADSEFIAENPAHTFSTGPVNSLRGASFLTKLKNCIVADIGGTSCDLAAMINGFARESSTYIEIGGVRTNFRMPNIQSIGIGGGSIIKFSDDGEKVKVGPTSVGYNLFTCGKSFNGDILTTTDFALKSGLCKIPGSNIEFVDLSSEQMEMIRNEIIRLLQINIDQMKTSSIECPLVLVGGGSVIIPKDTKFTGISEIILPEYFDIANAIGAAISKVSGYVDDIYSDTTKCSRDEYEIKVREKAIEKATIKGAFKELTSVTQIDKIDVAYMPGNMCRMKIKAIGHMNLSKLNDNIKPSSLTTDDQLTKDDKKIDPRVIDDAQHMDIKITFSDPKIVYNEESGRNEWLISEEDLQCIALGASILGSGGGGAYYHSFLGALDLLKKGYKIRVISPDDMKDDELALPVAYFGAPLCFIEKLYNFHELSTACEPLIKYYQSSKKVTCCIPAEIGGFNSIAPLWYGAIKDIPIIDADLMGRAFPRIDLTSTSLLGLQNPPIGLGDDHGNQIVVFQAYNNDNLIIEKFFRKSCDIMNLCAGVALDPLDKETIKNYTPNYTLSKAWRLGRAIIENRLRHCPLMDSLKKVENVEKLIDGKIIYLDRRIEGGYNKGLFDIEGVGEYQGLFMSVELQNENLIAIVRNTKEGRGKGEAVAVTPDLITVLDINTYDAILCEDLTYGIRVTVIVLPCHPVMKRKECLIKTGPKGFGYDVEYKPFAEYRESDSIIKEYCNK